MHSCLSNTDGLQGGCSMVGKPLCYHARDPSLVPRGGHTTRSPNLLALLGQLSLPPFELGK